MPSVFVTSTTAITRHGVFAISKSPPKKVNAIGTNQAAEVGQFPWGPDGSVFVPTTIKDMLNTVAPPGMSRTGSGYLNLIAKRWPLPPHIVRVTGPTASKATATVNKAGPVAMLTLTLKYKGTAGNSVTATTSAATDGDANHFDLAVTVTGASGTTTDTIRNLNYSGVGADSAPTTADFDKLLLLGAIAKLASGLPIIGTSTFSGAIDGSVTSAEYVGTAGTGDKGMALLEGDANVRAFFTDDPGNSLRAATNAGGLAHAELMGDRDFFTNGPQGQSAIATVQTDVANYRSERVGYCDAWVYITDDVDGSKRLVQSAPFAASVACQVSPSTSIAWKDPEVRSMLQGIVGLEYDRGQGTGTLTESGVMVFITEDTGEHTIESDNVTVYPSDASRGSLRRTRMGDYIAVSYCRSARPLVDAPNVPFYQQDAVGLLASLLGGLKRESTGNDPAHNPFIVDYGISDIGASNSTADIQSGKFEIDSQVNVGAAMSKIILGIQYGETVVVTHN